MKSPDWRVDSFLPSEPLRDSVELSSADGSMKIGNRRGGAAESSESSVESEVHVETSEVETEVRG